MLKAMSFWLDMGVDGLRMDAIPYLVERDGTNCENLPETHAAIKAIRAAIDEGYENRLVLAEANQWPADVRPYFGDGDECHMAFHFPLMPRMYMALRQEDRLPITDIMAQTPGIPDNCQWGLFLRNHDELTLEMVTDDERDYMYMAYSADPRMRINVGIRRRLAPLLDNNRRRIELMNSLLLSFPGTPIMYYGDELGMGDNIYLGDRNGVRTPMQWNSDRNAGFSKAVPARLYFPVIMDPIWGYQAINVEAQQSDPSSLLHWTRNMIALRKLFQVFGRGTLEFLHPENRKVLAYIRDLQREDGSPETVLCVANLSRFAQPVALDLAKFAGRQPVEMLGYVAFPEITDQPYPLTLAPYSFFWLELQPAAPKPEAPTIEPPADSEVLAGIAPNNAPTSQPLFISTSSGGRRARTPPATAAQLPGTTTLVWKQVAEDPLRCCWLFDGAGRRRVHHRADRHRLRRRKRRTLPASTGHCSGRFGRSSYASRRPKRFWQLWGMRRTDLYFTMPRQAKVFVRRCLGCLQLRQKMARPFWPRTHPYSIPPASPEQSLALARRSSPIPVFSSIRKRFSNSSGGWNPAKILMSR